jgi:hypothetical protein
MNADLEGYQDQLLAIRQDAPGLIGQLSDDDANWQPAPHRWSVTQCFHHLNLSARQFIPTFDQSIAAARAGGLTASGPFAYSFLERLFVQTLEPPPGFRLPTTKPFKPERALQAADVLSEFMTWQDEFSERLRRADGLDLRRARVRSPFLSLVRYSLGSAFAGFLAHERRHLWQARQVRRLLEHRRSTM